MGPLGRGSVLGALVVTVLAMVIIPIAARRGRRDWLDIGYAAVPSSILDSWMKDPAKKAQIHPARTNTYSYFYALNFNPKFAAEFEPYNWKVAVNLVNMQQQQVLQRCTWITRIGRSASWRADGGCVRGEQGAKLP